MFPEGNHGYSKDRGTTKAYRLRPTVLGALHAVYRSDEPVRLNVYDQSGNEVGIDMLGANGVPLSVADRLTVPSVLPVGLSEIDHAIGRIAGWIDQLPCYPLTQHIPLASEGYP
jgi:hypothetical protein